MMKSPAQARLTAAAAHNPAFAKKVGVPRPAANAADKRRGPIRKKPK